jgi:HEPN domain-containing protein
LKAALAARGHDFPFTHDLDGLREACITAGLSVPATLDEIDRLTPYAVHARYGSEDPRTITRAEGLEVATEAVAWAAAELSP